MYGLDEDHHSSIPTCRTYYTAITMKLHPTMFALPLAILPLVAAINLIASAGQPRIDRTNRELCNELRYELEQQTSRDMLSPAEVEAIYQRCLRDFAN